MIARSGGLQNQIVTRHDAPLLKPSRRLTPSAMSGAIVPRPPHSARPAGPSHSHASTYGPSRGAHRSVAAAAPATVPHSARTAADGKFGANGHGKSRLEQLQSPLTAQAVKAIGRAQVQSSEQHVLDAGPPPDFKKRQLIFDSLTKIVVGNQPMQSKGGLF